MLARIAARVQRLLWRRGLDPWEADGVQADPLGDESPTLAGISSASVQGRITLGPHADILTNNAYNPIFSHRNPERAG